MPRKIAPVLDEILKALDGILMSTSGKSFADFERDWLLRHGVQRGIEIISEASRHILARLKAEHPGVRWAAIAGIGNVLRHEYHSISDRVIWGVVRDEFPALRDVILALSRDLKE